MSGGLDLQDKICRVLAGRKLLHRPQMLYHLETVLFPSNFLQTVHLFSQMSNILMGRPSIRGRLLFTVLILRKSEV